MKISIEFMSNSVYFLDSVPDGEHSTAFSLFEDTFRNLGYKYKHLKSYRIPISSQKDLESAFNNIERNIKENGEKPMIHFDMHGNENGIQLKDDSFLKWEMLREGLTNINILMKNTLLVLLSSCKGAYLARILHPDKPAPCMALIGYEGDISASGCTCSFQEFYTELFSTKNLGRAFERLTTSSCEQNYSLATCFAMFNFVFNKYIDEQCSEPVLTQRVEDICRAAQEEGKIIDPKKDRELLVNHEYWFGKFKNEFFMIDKFPENSAKFSFTYAESRSWYEELRKKNNPNLR